MNAWIAGTKIASVRVSTPPQRRLTASKHGQSGACGVTVGFGALKRNGQPIVSSTNLVEKQLQWAVIIRDNDVHVTVVVHVAKCGAPANTGPA
jgi:hypothetical protein